MVNNTKTNAANAAVTTVCDADVKSCWRFMSMPYNAQSTTELKKMFFRTKTINTLMNVAMPINKIAHRFGAKPHPSQAIETKYTLIFAMVSIHIQAK